MQRVIVKKGDIFFVKINDTSKRYFQYITNDLKQLNSDIIRCFKKIYPIEDNPNLDEIIKDEIFFHVHCVVKLGVKLGCWEKVGNIDDVGKFEHILFRDTNDYGIIKGQEHVKISNNWYVWRINDPVSKKVGKLEGEYRKAEMGMVINPLGMIELLKGNKYPINYPDFE
jgi:hypothetical protein